jgi:hypothetical protein
MATPNQRAISICDALVNGVSTAGQRQRVLAAFGTAPDFLVEIRRFVLNRVISTEAAAPVAQAESQVSIAVAAEFQEAP